MNEKLKIYLEYFKKYSIEMVEDLDKDDLEDFERALNNRQQIIDRINEQHFNRDDFKDICEQLDIIKLNNELNKRIQSEKDKIKQEILKLKKSQSTNNAYHSNINESNIFSKKV